jgi:hypothetical protein
MGKKLNILDTPGYLDFISEALAAVGERWGQSSLLTLFPFSRSEGTSC